MPTMDAMTTTATTTATSMTSSMVSGALRVLLLRIRGKAEERKRRAWFDMQRTYYYKQRDAIRSERDLSTALEHFHVDLSPGELRFLFDAFRIVDPTDPTQSATVFDFQSFARAMFSDRDVDCFQPDPDHPAAPPPRGKRTAASLAAAAAARAAHAHVNEHKEEERDGTPTRHDATIQTDVSELDAFRLAHERSSSLSSTHARTTSGAAAAADAGRPRARTPIMAMHAPKHTRVATGLGPIPTHAYMLGKSRSDGLQHAACHGFEHAPRRLSSSSTTATTVSALTAARLTPPLTLRAYPDPIHSYPQQQQ